MDYETLLEKGMKAVPKQTGSGERFVVPKVVIEKAGRRTIIINVLEVAAALQRNPSHVIKFLLKELATKGELVGNRLFVLGVFTGDMINKKIELYVKNFVFCQDCGKPDTNLLKEGKFSVIRCEACGARHTLG